MHRPTPLPIAVLFNLHPDWPPRDKALVLRETTLLVDALKNQGYVVSSHPISSLRAAAKTLDHLNPNKCLVLNWCESLPGDPHKGEAAVAALLEKRGFTFTGSPAATLALSADKATTKQRLEHAGIPTPAGRIYQQPITDNWTHFPAIVKSAHEHSSASLSDKSVANDPSQLRRIVKKSFAADKRGVMVEAFVTGRELNVTVVGNMGRESASPTATVQTAGPSAPPHLTVLPPVEVWMDGRRDAVYSYNDKFGEQFGSPTSTRLVCPTRIGKIQMSVIRDVAVRAYRTLGCRDYARVDGRLNGRTFTVLDINPNPDLCMSAESAQAARAAGMSYGEFLSRIVALAARRKNVSHRGHRVH